MAKKPSSSDQLTLDAARLSVLFAGNQRSSGRYDPRNERMYTEYEPAKQVDFEQHLIGKLGLGVVPIQDDDTCMFAAIDIDHDSDEDLPIAEFGERIKQHKLPLITCRSKSGGVHCYLFLDKPQPCAKIRIFMDGWAKMIGAGGSEIFPKQARLVSGRDGARMHGNWINLPYFKGDTGNRYAVVDGEKLTLLQFLDHAEKMRVSEAELRSLSTVEHPDAPPCIQRMFANGVAQGHRNEALYNIVVYLKKAVPNEFEAKAVAANSSIFTKPLPRAEMQRTIASAGRQDCGYRCNEEPIRSLCDRETCVTRRFGITSGDLDRLNTVDALPVFADLTKYTTEPVRWDIRIDGVKIMNVKTVQLLDWRAMREMIADRLTKIVPMIKGQEWERILHPLMATARIIEAPDDASVSGFIRSKLLEFAAKTDLSNRGEDKADRKALLRGLPVVQVLEGERCVVFRAADFVNFLKRTKSEELKGVDLYMACRGCGIGHTKFRIPEVKDDANINVWYLPVKEVLRAQGGEPEPVQFRSEM